MSIKSLPKKTDFSNERIYSCFDKRVIENLVKLNSISLICFEKFNELVYGKIQEFNLDHSILIKLEKSVNLTLLKRKFESITLKKFSDKYKQPIDKCLFCRERNGIALEKCHIIEKKFFNKKNLIKSLKFFRNHPLNLVILCKNHHGYLDERRLKNGNDKRKRPALKRNQIQKLINNRKILNKKFLTDLKREIKFFEKILKSLNNFEKQIEKEVNKRFIKCVREIPTTKIL